MDYLFKVYYKDRDNYNKIYKDRLHFETTLKSNLIIRPYKTDEQYQLYYIYNNNTSAYIDQIRNNDNVLNNLKDSLPGIAKNAFLVDIISSELISSNKLEGVETNREEIVDTTRTILNKNKPKSKRLSSMISSYILLIDDRILKIPQDCKDIRKIYDEITKDEIDISDRLDGKFFRKDEVYVQKKGTVSDEIIHKGIFGEENIENGILNLLNMLDDKNIPLLLKVAIAHYYFGYIHPFYDGNGRVGRFISSLYIRQEYNYLTAMSLSRGCMLKKNDYYKAFRVTNSSINKGEMNYFIDEFLSILLKGQEDIIDNLTDKLDKLEYSERFIEEDKNIDSSLKKGLMFMLSQSYYFDNNSGISRDTLIEYAKGENAINRIKLELKDLELSGIIKRVKKRPLVYAVDDNYFS